MEEATQALDVGEDVDVIYLDFAKLLLISPVKDSLETVQDMASRARFTIG